MSRAVGMVLRGEAPKIVQDESQATDECVWRKELAHVNWTQDAQTVHNFIRGSARAPGAWTTVKGKQVTLFESQLHAPSSQIETISLGKRQHHAHTRAHTQHTQREREKEGRV